MTSDHEGCPTCGGRPVRFRSWPDQGTWHCPGPAADILPSSCSICQGIDIDDRCRACGRDMGMSTLRADQPRTLTRADDLPPMRGPWIDDRTDADPRHTAEEP
jgi:hypothetical protein